MRVLVLCAATFAGGLIAGAVLWPTAAPPARRTSEGAREAPVLPGDFSRGGSAPASAGAPAGSGPAVAAVPGGDTPLRELAHEAAAELGRALEGPAARAFLAGDGRIAGSVFDPSGVPVMGVIVAATPEAQPPELSVAARRARERAHEDVDLGVAARVAIEGELWRREARRTARTDSDGRYEIKGLVEGWHRVTAFHEEYDVQPYPRNNRVEPDAVVDFRAQPVGVVAVEVRMPDGGLADHAWLSWQGPHGNGADQWQPLRGDVRLPTGPCRVRAQTWFPEPLQSAETEYDAGVAGGPLVLKLEGRRMLTARLVPAQGLSVPEGVEFRLRRVERGADIDPASLKDDQARGASSSQGRGTWYDLEPGRYLVAAFLGGKHLLAHAVAEMGEGSSEILVPFDAPPAGTYLTAKVLVPEGGSTQGWTRFAVIAGPRGRSFNADALRRVDGSWLVLLPELPPDAAAGEAQLRVAAGGYGTAQEPFDLRRPGTVTLRFREPARLRLRVDRFAGSGVEGRLFASVQGAGGAGSSRQVEADGRCDLGALQPQDYALQLVVRDRNASWTILTTRIVAREGEQEESVSVPPLHSLRVRPAPNLRANEVTLISSDPAVGWMRRTARVEEGVASFDALAAASYEIRCGNRRVEARVPGPDVTVE